MKTSDFQIRTSDFESVGFNMTPGEVKDGTVAQAQHQVEDQERRILNQNTPDHTAQEVQRHEAFEQRRPRQLFAQVFAPAK